MQTGKLIKRGMLGLALLALAACGAPSAASVTYGANPDLPAPRPQSVPTVNILPVVGWGAGAPVAPEGFTVTRYAAGMSHPRWVYPLPNGDILVAQAATEAARGGLVTTIQNAVQEAAGAIADTPNNVILLRDTNADGVADQKSVFLAGLKQPLGMGVLVNSFYVANTDSLLRFPYADGQTEIKGPGEKLIDLPYRAGANGHWTRNLLIKFDGTKIYIAVGSVSDHAEAGEEAEKGRGAIYEINPNGSGLRVFASGLRNPVGMAWEPVTGALWTAVNERDALGEDLVPDYMTSVKEGGFYGWPYSYFGAHLDPRVKPQKPDLVATAIKPDYALGVHTASLGLTFNNHDAFPPHYRNGAFIGQHGSWNRKEPTGYKVIFVPFANGKPSGPPEDFLTGFLTAKPEARGRPVGVAFDRAGAMYVADDAGNTIWRVAAKR